MNNLGRRGRVFVKIVLYFSFFLRGGSGGGSLGSAQLRTLPSSHLFSQFFPSRPLPPPFNSAPPSHPIY
jgi:hypothetical protein